MSARANACIHISADLLRAVLSDIPEDWPKSMPRVALRAIEAQENILEELKRAAVVGVLGTDRKLRIARQFDALLAAAKPVVDAGVCKGRDAPYDTHGPGVIHASIGYRTVPALGTYRVLLIAADAQEENQR